MLKNCQCMISLGRYVPDHTKHSLFQNVHGTCVLNIRRQTKPINFEVGTDPSSHSRQPADPKMAVQLFPVPMCLRMVITLDPGVRSLLSTIVLYFSLG